MELWEKRVNLETILNDLEYQSIIPNKEMVRFFSFEKLVQSLFLTQFLKTKFSLDLARH